VLPPAPAACASQALASRHTQDPSTGTAYADDDDDCCCIRCRAYEVHVCVIEQVMELIQRLQTSQPSDDATSIKSAVSNADSGRGASDEGDARQRLLRATATSATGSGLFNYIIISAFRHIHL